MEMDNSISRAHIISYLKAFMMISRGCLYHIVRVKDLDSKNSTIELVPVVRELSSVFLNDLSGIPPKQEIDFGIDFLPNTNPFWISPYKTPPSKLKELKDLLDKGFLRPSISPWGGLVFYCFRIRRMGPLECALIIANSLKTLLRTSILSLGLTTCLKNSKGKATFLILT